MSTPHRGYATFGRKVIHAKRKNDDSASNSPPAAPKARKRPRPLSSSHDDVNGPSTLVIDDPKEFTTLCGVGNDPDDLVFKNSLKRKMVAYYHQYYKKKTKEARKNPELFGLPNRIDNREYLERFSIVQKALQQAITAAVKIDVEWQVLEDMQNL